MKVILTNVLLLAMLLSCLTLDGQTNQKDSVKTFRHSIGAGAGFATGYGLSYRYMPVKFGGQVNFAPYHTSETDRYSFGITFLYRLIETKTSNLFLYQGNHYYYNSETVYYADTNRTIQSIDPTGSKSRLKESYVNNGIGIGIEIIIAKRIGFNLMAGYAAYKNFEEVNFTGETALYFKF